MKWIISEDPADEKTFDGGFDALVKWHHWQTNTEWLLRQAQFSLLQHFCWSLNLLISEEDWTG
jgi:hypothetical protein